jgi:hypothetical protein
VFGLVERFHRFDLKNGACFSQRQSSVTAINDNYEGADSPMPRAGVNGVNHWYLHLIHLIQFDLI